MAHAVNAQYNMTPPNYTPLNYPANSQMYGNCWNTNSGQTVHRNQYPNWTPNQSIYGNDRRYMTPTGYFYSDRGQGIRIMRTVNDVLQTVGIVYLVISDISQQTKKTENAVEAVPISRSVTLSTGQVVTQYGYRINGQDYYQ